MLSGLLEKTQCAECRFCCVFDKEDFWEMPSLLPSTAKEILKINPKVVLRHYNGSYLFDISNIINNLYHCPALSENGCSLDDNLKPFECSIWPFRVMDFKGEIVLTICKDCEGLKGTSQKIIDDFANSKVRKVALDYVKKYPQAIKPYHENYRIISE